MDTEGTMPDGRYDGIKMPREVQEAVGRLAELVMGERTREAPMPPSSRTDFNLCSDWLAEIQCRPAITATPTLVEQLTQPAVLLDRLSAWGGPFGCVLTGRVLH